MVWPCRDSPFEEVKKSAWKKHCLLVCSHVRSVYFCLFGFFGAPHAMPPLFLVDKPTEPCVQASVARKKRTLSHRGDYIYRRLSPFARSRRLKGPIWSSLQRSADPWRTEFNGLKRETAMKNTFRLTDEQEVQRWLAVEYSTYVMILPSWSYRTRTDSL